MVHISADFVMKLVGLGGAAALGVEQIKGVDLSPEVKLGAFISFSASTIYHVLKSDHGATPPDNPSDQSDYFPGDGLLG